MQYSKQIDFSVVLEYSFYKAQLLIKRRIENALSSKKASWIGITNKIPVRTINQWLNLESIGPSKRYSCRYIFTVVSGSPQFALDPF